MSLDYVLFIIVSIIVVLGAIKFINEILWGFFFYKCNNYCNHHVLSFFGVLFYKVASRKKFFTEVVFMNQQEPKFVNMIILFIFVAITIALGFIRVINEIHYWIDFESKE